MDLYRNRIPFVLLIGAVAVIYVILTDSSNESDIITPCSEPISFFIDTVDTRFDVSREQVIEAFNEGAEAWARAAGKPLAHYAEEGEIPIRLIYDDRQKLVDGEFIYREQIRSEELRIEALQRQFEKDSLQFEQRKKQYETKADEVQRKILSLNQWVSQVNSSGGFRQDDSDSFDKRKAEIDRMERLLMIEDAELRRIADELNESIRRLNRMIDEKNRMVKHYNETYSGSRKFAQGTYQRSGDLKAIHIHQFSDYEELRLVLTHELGHALGLGHVDNSRSVMYPEMTRQPRSPLQLTREDTAAIQQICQTRTNI